MTSKRVSVPLGNYSLAALQCRAATQQAPVWVLLGACTCIHETIHMTPAGEPIQVHHMVLSMFRPFLNIKCYCSCHSKVSDINCSTVQGSVVLKASHLQSVSYAVQHPGWMIQERSSVDGISVTESAWQAPQKECTAVSKTQTLIPAPARCPGARLSHMACAMAVCSTCHGSL